MKTILQQLLFVASFAIVQGRYTQKVVGIRDASGQCICSLELPSVTFPVTIIETLESDFYNVTSVLQDILNQIYMFEQLVISASSNLTILETRLNYSRTFGTHIDLDFKRLVLDIHSAISLAQNISKNATTDSSRDMIDMLLQEINSINTVVTKMEKYDKRNIITAQQQISILQKKLQDCEDAILAGGPTSSFPAAASKPSVGKCDHDGLLSVSKPVLVKLNWRGPDFKAGAWGKDVALGTKFPDVFWVFPTNMDKRTLETFRLYSTMKKLTLYSPMKESSFNKPDKKCTDCGQGAGVVFFNGCFYYNCYYSRDVCKADPVTKKVRRVQFKDKDPATFNDFLSYKIAKFQDMDFAGDEKGMWLIHGSTLANGNVVIRKLDPNSLQIGAPWITTQPKERMTNSFMICGRLYATRELNATHEEIYYVYDTKTTREKNLKIPMEKPLPTVQSLKYNPNDQKLYLYNDGYLVYYNLTFKSRLPGRAGKAAETKELHSSETELSVVNQKGGATPSQANPRSASDQQEDLGNGETNAHPEEQPMSVTLDGQDTMREDDNYFLGS